MNRKSEYRNILIILVVVLGVTITGVIAELNTSENSSSEIIIDPNISINETGNSTIIDPTLSTDSEIPTQENTPSLDETSETTIPDSTPNVDEASESAVIYEDTSTPEVSEVSLTNSMQKIEDCVDEKFIESVPQYENCSLNTSICDDPPMNTSCQVFTQMYKCYIGSLSIEKTNKKCQTKGYQVGKYKLNTDEYSCSAVATNKDSTSVVCDSKYDGNGDGVCSSGESCMKFVITTDSIESYEKNSKDEFETSDESYFLNKIDTEVVQ